MPLQVANHWFESRRVDDAITVLWEPYVTRLGQSNIWHLRGRDRDMLVDSGCGFASLREAARDLFQHDVVAVASHTHFDHIGSHHEFAERLVHSIEAEGLRTASGRFTLLDIVLQAYAEDSAQQVITALPRAGFDILKDFAITPAPATRLLEEGDVIDLGDRDFEVLHLPGHAPGEIGLWERSTGIFFGGDAIYDGNILDEIPGASIDDYVRTMKRLRDLPITVFHGGHGPSGGRERFVEIIDAYLARRRPGGG